MPSSRINHQVMATLLLMAVLTMVGLAYAPGMGGDFHFDDRHNLAGLSRVDDDASALTFAVSGRAGPTGRPLALASFLVDRTAWPNEPGRFLRTNILIHLLNGLLVAWLGIRLGMARGEPVTRAGYQAAIAAGLWSVLPILASASLVIVQRMTTFSATFVLLGLIAYLAARRQLESRPGLALTAMSAGLTLFTLLAILAKENGALLPVLALVLECTLLTRPAVLQRSRWRVWRAVFLVMPLVLILAVLASMVPYAESTEAFRGFGAGERLLTQAVVLWQYLFNAFLPITIATFGPFQDTRPLHASLLEPAALLAVTGWLVAIVGAVTFRRRAPVPAFAVLWYLGAHLVESTVAPLELYFEHRNYVPLMGPAFALAWAVVKARPPLRTFAAVAAATYGGLLAITLFLITTTWGHPLQAAIEQYEENPRSERAIGYLFAHLYSLGATDPSLRLVERAIERGVAEDRYRVAQLLLACRGPHRGAGYPDPTQLAGGLKTAPFDRHLPRLLYLLTDASIRTGCERVPPARASDLVSSVAGNRNYASRDAALYWTHRAQADLAAHAGKRDAFLHHLEAAIASDYDPLLLERLTRALAGSGHGRRACRVVKTLGESDTWNPSRRLYLRLKTSQILEKLRREYPALAEVPACNHP